MEDTSQAATEAAKKNTDCIYFLASPLTCKKGAECEFRHLEGVRANPRDCWYWLNGNCLNPKCLFRHPPLEGLLVNPKSTFSGPNPTPEQASATSASSKLKTPCYYFQKGGCLKGDRCPFFHGGPGAISNPNPPQPAGKAAPPAPAPANPLRPPQSMRAENAAEAPSRSGFPQKIINGNGFAKSKKESSPSLDILVDAGGDSRRENLSHLAPSSEGASGDLRQGRREHRTPAEIDGSDLRLRLLKKRKGDGSLSSRREDEEDGHRRVHNSSGKDQLLPRGSSLGGRLRGRISLPGRSSSDSQRDEDKGKKETAEVQPRRRDGADSLSFSAPRSLVEQRAARFSDGSSRGGRMNRSMNIIQSQGSASFEGPKPLSEILKRKREAARGSDAAAAPAAPAPGHGDEIDRKVREGPIAADGEELPRMEAIDREEGLIEEGEVDPDAEDYSWRNGESEYYEGGEDLPQPEPSSPGPEMPEAEPDFPAEDMEDTEQSFDRSAGELEDDAAGEAVDEDEAEDEDGDDFARKIGIIFS